MRFLMQFVFLTFCLAIAATAQDLPAPLTDTVSDFANILPVADEARVSADLQASRDATGVHMVVATMSTPMGALPKERVEAYAKRLFNAWGIGDAARNDGILILVVSGERVVRIALGSGYDAVYDGRAIRVIDTAMLPHFREGALATGIVAGVASARARLIAPFLAGTAVTVDEGFPAQTTPFLAWVAGLLGVGGAGWFGGRAAWARWKRCPQCNQQTLIRRNEILMAATTMVSGNGIRHLNCPSCGFGESIPYTIAPRGSNDRHRGGGGGGGTGGSGGFGGGRSSGGGATGRW